MPCADAVIETGGSAPSESQPVKHIQQLRRMDVRSASLSGIAIRAGTGFTCFSHSLIVESNSRLRMTATLAAFFDSVMWVVSVPSR